jgi:aryl-alcohol dehydrogenase (NADP+)
MQYVRLGSSGLKVSRICLGAMSYGSKTWREWILEEDESRLFLRQALELGINFFDTADMYSFGRSEEILGQALEDFGPGRDKVVIATKVFNAMNDDPNGRGLSRKHIRHAIDDSLRRLRTDYVDLYQIHRLDHETPMQEILEGLHDVVRAGKALYIGASSMYAWQFAKMLYLADQLGRTRFVSMQNHYNLVYREEEREMLPLCRAEGIAVLPWSPLARGFLTRPDETVRSRTDDYGKTLYGSAADHAVAAKLTEVASLRGIPNAQVALSWLLGQPGVTSPIVGATKMHHLEDAVAALDVHLSSDEIAELNGAYEPHRVLGHS